MVIFVTTQKKHRYLQLYVPTEEVEELVNRLGKEKFIKKVESLSYPKKLETPFVGNLYKTSEKRYH